MSTTYEAVFSPIKIGNLQIRNRVQIAPMEGTAPIDWMVSCKAQPEKVRDYYLERADDGVGLMIPGMIPLQSMIWGRWLYKNPKVFDKVKPLIDEIHAHGAKIFFQLGLFSGRNAVLPTQASKLIDHKVLGFLARPVYNVRDQLVSADAGAPRVFMPEYACRALSTEEVEHLVQAYARTAALCKGIGVDGVEVHAVHEGYLMDQFTLPYTNHRTDKYGGSFENRYRFATEVVQAIKEACGADYPVSMRYSVTSKTIGFNQGAVPGEEFEEAGRTMEESERAIRLLEDAGVDMFNCDNGTYDAWFWAHPPVYMPLNCNLAEVEHIKQFTSKPVYCAGRMQMNVAEEAIAAGRIDGVAVGRQFLVDEHFLTKLREGREDEVKPCIGCHAGCLPMSTWKGVGVEMDMSGGANGRMCALNCRTFAEGTYSPMPAATPKRIAVVGGGVGGMEFALQAARRGHTVDLYEKTDRLGGAFIAAAALSFKEKDRELLAWFERELAASPVTVHMGTEVTDLAQLECDEVVVATGAKGPRRLRVMGAERAIDATTYLLDQSLAGQDVAVIGGGLTGCEIAYELALQGKRPFIVEMQEDLVKAVGVCYANSSMLRELMRYHEVPVYLESQTKQVTPTSVIIQTPEGTLELPADTVITSIGYEAGSPFEGAEGAHEGHVHVLGDAAKVGNLKSAIWAANDLVVGL